MAKRKKELAPGVATSFNSPARAKELKLVRVLWQSAEFDNAQQAIKAIGSEFPELAGMSRSTAERVTGVGRTNRSKKRLQRNKTWRNTKMQNAKQEAIDAIKRLPDSADTEEIMYRLYVLKNVRRGQQDAESDKTETAEMCSRKSRNGEVDGSRQITTSPYSQFHCS